MLSGIEDALIISEETHRMDSNRLEVDAKFKNVTLPKMPGAKGTIPVKAG
jgi:hypothetical protein